MNDSSNKGANHWVEKAMADRVSHPNRFDHLAGLAVEGASVFWIRRQAAIGGEQAALEHWQFKRDKTRRGIVEVISDDQELEATKERIAYFQQQVEKLRQVETNPQNYRLSAGGYLAEIDRMNLEIREYLSYTPAK